MRAAWRFGWRLFVLSVIGTLASAVVVLTIIGFVQGHLRAPLMALYLASLLMIVVVPLAAVVAVVAAVVLARRQTKLRLRARERAEAVVTRPATIAGVDEVEPLERFRQAAVDWAAGGPGQGLVDAAAFALAAGLDSPTLRMLAGAPVSLLRTRLANWLRTCSTSLVSTSLHG